MKLITLEIQSAVSARMKLFLRDYLLVFTA